jgi:hypothetical protein
MSHPRRNYCFEETVIPSGITVLKKAYAVYNYCTDTAYGRY